MCTVVCAWDPADVLPVRMLAIRDELVTRPFDSPDAWWPQQGAAIVGGRDRQAGGTWCATDVSGGRTAVVLNSPIKRVAEPGAASRGMLPLLAASEGAGWTERIDLAPMAAFHLLLATPERLTYWSFDGIDLVERQLPSGVHIVTPRGLEETAPDPRFSCTAGPAASLTGRTESVWADWLEVLADSDPKPDRQALLVKVQTPAGAFESVFGQFIASRPGSLRLDWAAPPRPARSVWTTEHWESTDAGTRRDRDAAGPTILS